MLHFSGNVTKQISVFGPPALKKASRCLMTSVRELAEKQNEVLSSIQGTAITANQTFLQIQNDMGILKMDVVNDFCSAEVVYLFYVLMCFL